MQQSLHEALESYFGKVHAQPLHEIVPTSSSSSSYGTFEDETNYYNIIRTYFFSKFENKVGCFSWKSKFLQVTSLLIAAIGFSDIVGEKTLTAFLGEDKSSEASYKYSFTALSHIVFAFTTHLAHSIYVYTEEIDAKCRANKDLYSEFVNSNNLLAHYFSATDMESHGNNAINLAEQRKLIGYIVVQSFEKALSKRNIASIKSLNDYRLPEYVFNIIIALNKYLIEQKSYLFINKNENGNAQFLNYELSNEIIEEFANIIASTMINRLWFSNLAKGYKPEHIKLDFAPSIASFSEIINEVVSRTNALNNSNQSIQSYDTSDEHLEQSKGKEIDRSSSHTSIQSSDDSEAKQEPSDNRTNTTTNVNEAENRAKGYHKVDKARNKIYEQFLNDKPHSNHIFSEFIGGVGRFHQHIEHNNTASNLYKLLATGSASIAVNDPFSSTTKLAVLYRYLLMCGALFASWCGYSLYARVRDIKTHNHDTEQNLNEALRKLYAKRLIIKNAYGEYEVEPVIEQTHQIIRNVFQVLEEEFQINTNKLNKDLKAQIVAKIYIGIAEVILEEHKKNRCFKFNEQDEIKEISKAIAENIHESIGISIKSLTETKNPRKYTETHMISPRIISDIVRARIHHTAHDKSWVERINEQRPGIGIAAA